MAPLLVILRMFIINFWSPLKTYVVCDVSFSFAGTADLFGRLYKNPVGILMYFKEFLDNLTDKDVPQTSGRGF